MGDSTDEDKKFYCSTTDDFVEFNKYDYMILFQSLDSIRNTSREYLTYKISAEDAFKWIKGQYSDYACNVRKNIENNRKNKKLIETIFGLIVYLLSISYSIWIVSQLVRIVKGRYQASVSLIYGMVFLVLLNPMFSFLTITFDVISYQSQFQIDKKKKENLKKLQEAIEKALGCENPDEFTREKVCSYYKYFEDRKNGEESLCPCSPGTGVTCAEDLQIDPLSNKMEKMDNINQFFENQKKFVMKIHNPYTKVKHSDSIDRVIAFCLGSDMEKTIRYHMDSNNPTEKLMAENSQTIRENAIKLLERIESFNYKDIGVVTDFTQYFITDLNTHFFNLTKDVLLFMSYDNNKTVHVTNNPKVKNPLFAGEGVNNIVFRCNNYDSSKLYPNAYTTTNIDVGFVPNKDSILQSMMEIQTRLKRLNKLWLPEYEYLHNFLYSESNVDVSIQKMLYRATSVRDTRTAFNDVIAIVLNNTHLISDTMRDVYVPNGAMNSATTCVIQQDTARTYRSMKHVLPNRINITSYYATDYQSKDTMMMTKMDSFVKSLAQNSLGKYFMNTFKFETAIVRNIIDNEIGDMLAVHSGKVKDYIIYHVKEKKRYFGADERLETLFVNNMNKLVDHAYDKRKQSEKNSELVFNAKNEIEYPSKYIPFEEFDLKLRDLNNQEFEKYVNLVTDIDSDVEYITENVKLMDKDLERDHHMANMYGDYMKIYFVISFLILIDMSWREYFGMSIDEYITGKLFEREMNRGVDTGTGAPKQSMMSKMKEWYNKGVGSVNELRSKMKQEGTAPEQAAAPVVASEPVAPAQPSAPPASASEPSAPPLAALPASASASSENRARWLNAKAKVASVAPASASSENRARWLNAKAKVAPVAPARHAANIWKKNTKNSASSKASVSPTNGMWRKAIAKVKNVKK